MSNLHNENIKPRQGVHLMIVDEHIKRMVEREKIIFRKELESVLSAFKKSVAKELKQLKRSLRSTSLNLSDVREFSLLSLNYLDRKINDIDKNNSLEGGGAKLKKPVLVVRKESTKNNIEDEDENDDLFDE